MTVVRPNSIAGINSITVQTGQALNIHDASGNLIRNLTSSSGVSTYQALHVGSGTTTSTQGISVGTGCSIISETVNTLDVYTAASKRLTIDSSGRLLLGTTTEGHAAADNLTITDSGNCGITIRSGTSNGGNIYFSDGTSGADEYRGYVNYNHSSNYMMLATNGSERLRITSGGNVNIGGTSGDYTQTSSKLFVTGGSGSDGNITLLQLKHGNTASSSGAGDGPALLLDGEYGNNPWAFAKICSVNSGSGYGADFQVHVHPADGTQGSAVVKALSILGDGGSGANVTITDGNLVIGTAGHGIDFSATSDAGGKSSELLDDYEEGTWTPGFQMDGGGASFTYDERYGTYTKIGRTVHFECWIDIQSVDANGSGSYCKLTGLPFNSLNSTTYGGMFSPYYLGLNNVSLRGVLVEKNDNFAYVYQNWETDGTIDNATVASLLTASSRIVLVGSYTTP